MGGTRGGLAYVVVIVNMIMAGVSGAAVADAAAVGSVMIPGMVKAGYRRGFAAAVNAAAATVGPVIPPSVGFLIYSFFANVSAGPPSLACPIPFLISATYLLPPPPFPSPLPSPLLPLPPFPLSPLLFLLPLPIQVPYQVL